MPLKTSIEIALEPWYLGEGTVKAMVVHQGLQAMEVTGTPTVVAAAVSRWVATGGEQLLEERVKPTPDTYDPRFPGGGVPR